MSLRFEMEVKGAYTKDTKMAALDQDEIEGLIKSIRTMQEKVFSGLIVLIGERPRHDVVGIAFLGEGLAIVPRGRIANCFLT